MTEGLVIKLWQVWLTVAGFLEVDCAGDQFWKRDLVVFD